MFDLLLRRWPISMGWYFDKSQDPGTGAQPDPSTEDPAGDDQPDASKAGDDPKKAKEEKTYSKAEVEDIVKQRLDRERKKSEAEAEKARKEAEDAALAQNQEWQQLAEKRAKDLDALTKERDELAPFKEQAEKYQAALKAQLDKIKERLPDYLQEVVDRMDPVDAMAYITKHADKIGAKTPETYGETPEAKERKVTDEERTAAQKAGARIIHSVF